MPVAEFRLAGYAPDLPDDAVPPGMWSGLSNVLHRDGVSWRPLGDTDKLWDPASATPVCTVMKAWPWGTTAAQYRSVLYAGHVNAGSTARLGFFDTAGAHQNYTPGAWSGSSTRFMGCEFGGGFLVSGGEVATRPLVWLAPSGGAATTCTTGAAFIQAVRAFRNHAVVLDNPTTGSNIRWSASTPPLTAPITWTAAAGNDAGTLQPSTDSGALIDCLQLGDQLVVYGTRSVWLMDEIGGPTVMQLRRLSGNTGMAQNMLDAVVNAGRGVQYALLQDDVVRVTAAGMESIARGVIARDILSAIYAASGVGDQLGRSSLAWDQGRGQLWLLVQTSRANNLWPSRAYVYDEVSGKWGRRDLDNRSCALWSEQYTNTDRGNGRFYLGYLANDNTTNTSTLYETDTGSTNALESIWVKSEIDLGDASRVKTVTGIRLRGQTTGAATLKVSVAGKFSPEEAWSYGTEVDYAMATANRADLFATGRWLSVKIRAPAGQPGLTLAGFDLEFTPRGRH